MNPEVPAGPNVKQVVPFLAVSDIQASVQFYVDGLGFSMTNHWSPEGRLRWCWLQNGGAALMVQEYSQEGHGAWAPEGKLGQGVTLCFMCEDALALYHAALERELKPRRPFVGNGLWVLDLTDPDGYRLEFESPTDLPEETQYEEGMA